LVSFILGLKVNGRPIADEEAKAAVLLACLGSGHTVTSHLGYLFKFFAEHPEVQQKVVSDPDSIDRVGEEVLRAYSLFGHDRIVKQDTELDGCPLKAGDKVFVMYTMPNRDPRCPGFDELDLDREPNRHMSFNIGAHRCLGIHWARGARRVAVEEWHRVIPSYRLDDGVRLVEQVYAGVGYHHLPLLWKS
jgi:cytochrome P450